MQYDVFIKEVNTRARFQNRDESIKAVEAALRALSNRLQNDEAEHLKAQLPEEMKSFIKSDERIEKLSLREFFYRVGEYENTDPLEAEKHARVVIEVLEEAISPGEIQHLKDALPEEYNELFSQSVKSG